MNGCPSLTNSTTASRELRAGGPRLVDARTGEDVGAARAFADAREAVAAEHRLAAAAGFLQDSSRPRTAACRLSDIARDRGAAMKCCRYR